MHTATDELAEKRRSPRQRRSDVLFWRNVGSAEYEMGLTLEASDDGLAFAWRGVLAPQAGSIIDIHRRGEDLDTAPERALVRRVKVAHDDLTVIAAQIIPTAADITKAACEVSIKPVRSPSRPLRV